MVLPKSIKKSKMEVWNLVGPGAEVIWRGVDGKYYEDIVSRGSGGSDIEMLTCTIYIERITHVKGPQGWVSYL